MRMAADPAPIGVVGVGRMGRGIVDQVATMKGLRVMALGVIEEFRTAGVAAGFYATLIRQAQRLGYGECEFSWVLEDNILMNRSIESLGARRYKTYRLYEGTYNYA